MYENGKVNSQQAQALAGFLMAVDEANNDYLLLPNHKVEVAIADPTGLINATLTSIELSESVDAVVGAVQNYETMISNKILAYYHKVQISSVARSALLSVGKDYPLKARVVPSDSFSGMSLQNFGLYRMGYTRVVTFTNDDFTQMKCADDLNDQTWAIPDYLGQYTLASSMGQVEFPSEIDAAKETGAKVFFLFMDPKTAGLLLEQGYHAKLFHTDTIIFMSEFLIDRYPQIYAAMSPNAPVKEIMKGVFGIKFDLADYFLSSNAGKDWITKWRQQPATITGSGPGATCVSAYDDGGQYMLYKDVASGLCGGLNFTTFSADGSDIDVAAPYTYDATMVLLKSLDDLYKHKSVSYKPNGRELYQAMLMNITYEGVTGLIVVNSGMILVDGTYVNVGSASNDASTEAASVYDFFARGDRESGNTLLIYNFNEADYDRNNTSGGMVVVGKYRVEEGDQSFFQLCGDTTVDQYNGLDATKGASAIQCPFNVQYRTADNTPPPERSPTIKIDTTSEGNITAVIVVAAFGISATLFIAAVLLFNSKNPLVKSIQPVMVSITLTGEFVAAVRALLLVAPLSNSICKAEIAVGHIAFLLVFVVLLIKTWRVHSFMVTSAVRKVNFTTQDSLKAVAAIMSVFVAYLIVVLVVGNSTVVYSETDIANQLTDTYFCSEAVPSLQMALCIAEIVMLGFVCNYAFAVRSLPGAVNETYTILAGTVAVGVLGIAVFMASQTGSLGPIYQRFLSAMAFAIAAALTSWLFYGHRVFELVRKPKIAILKKKSGEGAPSPNDAAEEGAEEKKKLVKTARDALKRLKEEAAKAQLCADQIAFWYGTLSALSAHEYESGLSSKSEAAESAIVHSRQVSRSLKDMKISQKALARKSRGNGGNFSLEAPVAAIQAAARKLSRSGSGSALSEQP